MKKFLQIFFSSFSLLILCPGLSFSQSYWNEWINFSQKYYKIPITQNGIYRIDSLTLANAGITSVNPQNFQLFFRGQEQYIYVKGEADGIFNASDYIEFYGQKNDGSLDSILYKGDLYDQPVHQPNPYYSLFNDTAAYFLTWNNLTTNKRIVDDPDTVSGSLQPTIYFMKKDVIENHTTYYYGKFTTTNINFPEYHEAEGWSGVDFNIGDSHTVSFNTSDREPLGPNAIVKLSAMGESNDPSYPDHHLQIKYKDVSNNLIQLDDTSFDGYALFDPSFSINASSLGSSTDIVISLLSGNFSTSRTTVPYVTLKYPHNMNLGNNNYFELFVPYNTIQSKSFFTLTNFNVSTSTSAYLYDFTDHRRIPVTKNGNNYKVLVANYSLNLPVEKFCVIKSENQFISVPSLKPVRGTGSFIDYSSFAPDSAFIIITHKSLMSGAKAYASYRASTMGGSHDTLVADIDDLYDEFAYGIPKHPFAIRHFADYCTDKFPSLPQNLFLIGKSIQGDLTRNQYADPTGSNYADCLVPSIGYPTSDNMLVAVLNGNLLVPAIPLGRLAAKNIGDIAIYLHKVDEYEHPLPDPDEWMKHIIHLAGGHTFAESVTFAGYNSGYETIIEDTCFGGYVHSFKKNSSSPTQTSFTDSIKGLINSGVSMITFFGHSSASIFDFNLLPPNQYDNTNGKYPFFGAYGCSAGDIHQPVSYGLSSSEQYVITDKGMIAFLASSGPGTPGDLDQFASNLYSGIGHYLYGKSIGKCIQYSIGKIEGTGSDVLRNATCLEMTLHGDPSIIIHSKKLPDYAVNTTSVYFTPVYVSTDLDSFDANVIVTNIGRATHDSVIVNIRRTFADGTSSSYSDTFPYIFYKDTMKFTLPVDPIHGPGLNKFEVHVLHTNPELSYLNNDISSPYEIPLMIYSGDIIPVYPYKYAIVPKDTIMLKAYTANPFATSHTYIFEIDTTDLFNSPQKKIQYVTQSGAVVKAPYNLWSPSSLILMDSAVYFWRVRRDTNDFVNYKWRESSFQYIAGKRGWGQSHFFQFLKGDRFHYIDTNRVSRYFDLEYQNHTLEVKSVNHSVSSLQNGTFSIDGTFVSQGSYSANSHVLISVIDPVTGVIWNNIGAYGDVPIPANPPPNRFEFYTNTPAEQETLRSFLQDIIPCGSKVILFVDNNHNLGDLLGGNGPNTNPGLVQAFQSIGGTQFSNIQNNLPYALIGRKCGAAVEAIGDDPTAIIFAYDSLQVKRDNGYIYSEIIGPASKWKSLHWKYISPEQYTNPSLAAKDTIKICVVGFRSNGTPDTLIKAITKDSLDVYNLDASINADTFPNLQLIAWVKDSIKRTPAQLKFWRVYYDGVPDAALNPVKHFSFYKPTVQQGDSIKMSVAIENIGDYDMDSLWVDFWVYDANRNKVPIKSMKMDSLKIDSILIPDVKFSTINIPGGLNSLWVEANPFNSQHQMEQYHFNNIGTIPFNVNVDRINPILDVTFDGVHIMNGDIVSAKPSVLIKLKDENTFLALNDPSDFDVFIKRPGENKFDTIAFGSIMTFESAVLPNNSCKINYKPSLLQDGTYELKVHAKDRSGNVSGYVEYKISFEVINKPTVSSVLNYPNPFSTSTRFVFTLTGSEVPDYFKIQILTITGKIVREIDKYELGLLHIGRNITDYAWDGKDEFGDQLANGLYLYRVITQLDGKSLEHRESGADSFFTLGYGKMYLIR